MELRLSYLTSLEMIEHDLALKQIIHTTKQRLAIVENLMAYIKRQVIMPESHSTSTDEYGTKISCFFLKH
jgi:hypothetical protein